MCNARVSQPIDRANWQMCLSASALIILATFNRFVFMLVIVCRFLFLFHFLCPSLAAQIIWLTENHVVKHSFFPR